MKNIRYSFFSMKPITNTTYLLQNCASQIRANKRMEKNTFLYFAKMKIKISNSYRDYRKDKGSSNPNEPKKRIKA